MADIINPVFTVNTVPSKAKMVVGNLDKGRIELYTTVDKLHKREYNRFWNNSNATPQEICDEAIDPMKFFEISTKTQELLAMLNPYIDEENPGYKIIGVPEGCSISMNEEKKITITDTREKLAPGDGVNPKFAVPIIL